MPTKKTSITTYGGEQAEVRHLENTEDGARLKVTHPDGRAWICAVEFPSGDVDIEVTRHDGAPADLEVPEWLEDNLAHLAAPA